MSAPILLTVCVLFDFLILLLIFFDIIPKLIFHSQFGMSSNNRFSANRSPTSNYRHLTIKNNTMHHSDVHRFGTETGYTPGQIQLDYNGRTCSAENFLNILTGNHPKDFPRNMRLNSNKNSHVLLYMTGHGGDEFFKFHDSQELSSDSFGAAISEMYASNRYREMLLVIDTCQASTMANHITSPGVSVISSSTRGENSYAFDKNNIIGLAVIDRFTYLLVQYLQLIRKRKLSERKQQKEVIKNNNIEGYCNLLEIDEIRMNENHKLKIFKITHKLSEFLKYLRQPSRKAFLHSTPILVQTRENNFSRETKQKKWDVNLNNYMNSNKICAYCTESCRGTLTEVCSILVNENLFVPDASFEFEGDLLSDL